MQYNDPNMMNKQNMMQQDHFQNPGPYVTQDNQYAAPFEEQNQYVDPYAVQPNMMQPPYVDPATLQNQQQLPNQTTTSFISIQGLKASIGNNLYPIGILKINGVLSILFGILFFILNFVFNGYGYWFVYFGFITDILCIVDGALCLSATKPVNQTARTLVNVRNSYISLNILVFIDLLTYSIYHGTLSSYSFYYYSFNTSALSATIAFLVIFFVINCIFCVVIYRKIGIMFPGFRGWVYSQQPTVVVIQQQQQPNYV